MSKPRKRIKISVQEIINKAKEKPNYYRNYLNRADDYLKWGFFHTREHLIDWGELNEIYRQKLKKGEVSKKEFKLLDFGFSKLTLSLFNEREFKKILKQYWQIIEETYERKHLLYKDFYRIYLLKKKQNG